MSQLIISSFLSLISTLAFADSENYQYAIPDYAIHNPQSYSCSLLIEKVAANTWNSRVVASTYMTAVADQVVTTNGAPGSGDTYTVYEGMSAEGRYSGLVIGYSIWRNKHGRKAGADVVVYRRSGDSMLATLSAIMPYGNLQDQMIAKIDDIKNAEIRSFYSTDGQYRFLANCNFGNSK